MSKGRNNDWVDGSSVHRHIPRANGIISTAEKTFQRLCYVLTAAVYEVVGTLLVDLLGLTNKIHAVLSPQNKLYLIIYAFFLYPPIQLISSGIIEHLN